MKRTSLLISLIALSLPIAGAAPTTDAKKADATPAPAKAEPATAATAEGEAAADKTDKDDAAKAEAEKVEDGNVDVEKENAKAVDASRRLREKLAQVDKELAALTKPSRSLEMRCKRGKESITTQLERLDKVAMETAALQEKFNSGSSGGYEFSIVRGEDRDQYVRDGQAAYKAMIIDVNEKRTTRKIKGMEKYEIMNERYQGMPEFKQASEWYAKTIDDLDKRWSKMLAAEKGRREKLNAAKKQRMEEDDEKDFEKLEAEFKKAGDDISQVWYTPSARNLRMLNNCVNKIKDVKRRRSSSTEKTNNIGCVPGLLTEFWSMMDNARDLLLSGDLEGATATIKNDETFNRMMRLNRNVMPDEYREPIRKQRQELLDEINRRDKSLRTIRNSLDKKLQEVERMNGNIESRIDSLLEDIDKERGLDAGENTASVSDAEMTPDKPDKTTVDPKTETAAAPAPANAAPADKPADPVAAQ